MKHVEYDRTPCDYRGLGVNSTVQNPLWFLRELEQTDGLFAECLSVRAAREDHGSCLFLCGNSNVVIGGWRRFDDTLNEGLRVQPSGRTGSQGGVRGESGGRPPTSNTDPDPPPSPPPLLPTPPPLLLLRSCGSFQRLKSRLHVIKYYFMILKTQELIN